MAGFGLGGEGEFGGLENVGLGHGFFGAIEAVEDEFAEETEADLAGDGDVVLSLLVDQKYMIAAAVAADIDVFSELNVTLGAHDYHTTVAPGAQAVGGEPIQTHVIGGAVITEEVGLAAVFQFRGVGIVVIGHGGMHDLGIGGAGEGEKLFELMAADIAEDAAVFSCSKNQSGREGLLRRWGPRPRTWRTRPMAPPAMRSVAYMALSTWRRSLK